MISSSYRSMFPIIMNAVGVDVSIFYKIMLSTCDFYSSSMLFGAAYRGCLRRTCWHRSRMLRSRRTFSGWVLLGWSWCDVLSPYSIELATSSMNESMR
jgi:hypothetical protein